MTTTAQALLETPLGSVLGAAEAAELAQAATVRTIARGQHLFRAGDRGTALYVILSGSLEVVLGSKSAGETVVATLGPGQIAGELEVMTQSARVASLIATEDASLLELPASRLESMLESHRPAATKLVTTIAKVLARRLAAVNQRIVGRAAPAAPLAQEAQEPVEVSDQDVVPVIADDDLEVLDKLWG